MRSRDLLHTTSAIAGMQQHKMSCHMSTRESLHTTATALSCRLQPGPRPYLRGRSNSASRARPGLHQRSGSLDAVTLNTKSGGAQSLVSPPDPTGFASSAQEAARGSDAQQLGARAGRGSRGEGHLQPAGA